MAEAKAADIKRSRAGRRKGGELSNTPSAIRSRARYARLKGGEEPEGDERPPYVPDPATVAMAGALGNALWNLSRIFTHRRELSAEEQGQLGAAIDPVLYKYLPALNDWACEIGLVSTVWALWSATTPPKSEGEQNGAKHGDGGDRPQGIGEVHAVE